MQYLFAMIMAPGKERQLHVIVTVRVYTWHMVQILK